MSCTPYDRGVELADGTVKSYTLNASKTENIIGKINGLYPSPGAFFIYKGERYKILKAKLRL